MAARRAASVVTFLVVLSSFFSSLPNTAAGSSTNDSVRRFELPNGLLAVISPSEKAQTVSIHLAVRTGSSDEGDWLGSGLSHFVEHMLFKGTDRRKTGDIEEEVRRMGGSTNAYTSYDLTVFYLNCLADSSDKALDLFSDVAFNSAFPAAEFKKERDVILAEFRMNEDQIDRKADLELWKLIFRDHPYGVPVIGYRQLFEKTSREDLVAFYRRFYVPNNMVLTVVGNVDVGRTEETIRRLFGPAPRGAMRREAKTVEQAQITPRSSVMSEATPHARLVLGFPGVSLAHSDSAVLDVVSAALGDGTSSRLNQAVKERASAALDISSFNATLKEAGVFGAHALALPDRLDEVRRLVLLEVKRITNEDVTPPELERIKNQVLASYYRNRETHASLAHDYVTNEVYAGDYRFSEVYVERVKSVTAADVRRAAAAYLRGDVLSEVRVFPKDFVAVPAHQVGTAGEKTELKRTVLPNGLTLLLERDASSPDVVMQFAAHGGLRYEAPETNGVSELASTLLTRGTSNRSQSEIAALTEGWGGTVSGFSGLNSLGITMTSLAEYRDDAFRLFAELIKDPAFNEEEIAKAKALQHEELLGRSDNIFGLATQFLRRNLFLKHPYGMDPLGTEASIAGLKGNDLHAFYKRTFRPERATLVVTGNIDIKAAESLAMELFGSWKTAASEAPVLEVERVGEVRNVTEHVRREQAVVSVAFGGIAVTDKRRYAFEILNAVMNGSAGRLYNRIRGQSGLSYVTGSSLTMGVDPGYFALYASVEPSKAEETLKMILKEVDELRRNGITDEELESARTQLVGDHEHVLESKASRALELGFSELYGMGIESFRDYPRRVRRVTRTDVQRLVGEFVDPARSLRLIVTPPEGREKA